jgi:hypothetical protein
VNSRTIGLVLVGGAGLGAIAFLGRKQVMTAAGVVLDQAKILAFKALVPSAARQYVDDIVAISAQKGVDPLITYALGNRESQWGAALTPPGPGGTGDFAARNWTIDTEGKLGEKGKLYPMPPDGRGWGRGLLQLDWWYYRDWMLANDWTNPRIMIAKGLDELKQHVAFFTSKKPLAGVSDGKVVTIPSSVASRYGVTSGTYADPRPLTGNALWEAALAAYNGGDKNVLRSVAVGKDPDTTTSGGNYSTAVLTRAASLAKSLGIA